MAKYPTCKSLIKNYKNQRTEHRGMTCQNEKPLEAEDMCSEAYSNYEMADYLIKNYKGQKTKHRGVFFQERKSSDE